MPTTEFTATGNSPGVPIQGKASILIASKSDGGVGTVVIERSVDRQNVATDAAATWLAYSQNAAGDDAAYAMAGNADVGFNGVIDEPAPGIYYRGRCSAFTSGSVYFALGAAAVPFGAGPQ